MFLMFLCVRVVVVGGHSTGDFQLALLFWGEPLKVVAALNHFDEEILD